MVIKTK